MTHLVANHLHNCSYSVCNLIATTVFCHAACPLDRVIARLEELPLSGPSVPSENACLSLLIKVTPKASTQAKREQDENGVSSDKSGLQLSLCNACERYHKSPF